MPAALYPIWLERNVCLCLVEVMHLKEVADAFVVGVRDSSSLRDGSTDMVG